MVRNYSDISGKNATFVYKSKIEKYNSKRIRPKKLKLIMSLRLAYIVINFIILSDNFSLIL